MSTDTTPENFNEQPWHVLVGIRPAGPDTPAGSIIVGMSAAEEAMIDSAHGLRPDKTNPAVHFAMWLERNRAALVGMWEVEYAQYLNLQRLTSRPKDNVPGLQIVASNGERLQ